MARRLVSGSITAVSEDEFVEEASVVGGWGGGCEGKIGFEAESSSTRSSGARQPDVPAA